MASKGTLVVVHGLPGSGKTPLAEKISKERGGVTAGIDQYFERNGDYKFRHSDLHRARGFCEGQIDAYMRMGVAVIVAEGVYPTPASLRVCKELAKKYEYSVELVTPELPNPLDLHALAHNSTHNVPFRVIERLHKHFEAFKEAA